MATAAATTMDAAPSPPPPAVPPRSILRSQVPPPINTTATVPMNTSASDFSLAESALASPPPMTTPTLNVSSPTSDFGSPGKSTSPPGSFGRKKKAPPPSLSRDPHRIRDGAQARKSSSGVYTPPSFPGPAGSSSPSRQGSQGSTSNGVYTPASFQLGPPLPSSQGNRTSKIGESSRSSSVSSADSDTPVTPASASSRLSSISGRAMTGFKRISQQVASNMPKTPLSARDSYFPPYATVSEQQQAQQTIPPVPSTPSWPARPHSHNGFTSPSPNKGLGMNLPENGPSQTFSPDRDSPEQSTPTVLFDDASDFTSPAKSPPASRGYRKPVPKAIDESVMQRMSELRVEEEKTHAM